ncbi:MAG: patatin-like phospholipase family protein [Leptospira sp.]|nr:patatin-like phospholipase family protein [Leptospira sp.]
MNEKVSKKAQAVRGHSRIKTGLCLNSAFFGFFAHCGFVQGLHEIGFKPDSITGCSAGALVGALYATGMHPEDMRRLMEKIEKKDFWEGNLFSQMLKPFHKGFKNYSGLLSGKKLRHLLLPYFGETRIEDLKIPLGIAVSNITKKKRELKTKGNLLDAIVASMAFPLLFEVQKIDNEEFLDGGVADHEPILEMILDKSISRIVIHSINSRDKVPVNTFKRAWGASVSIIEKETQSLKELIAIEKKKPLLRFETITPRLGPDKLHIGRDMIETGRQTALNNRKLILG